MPTTPQEEEEHNRHSFLARYGATILRGGIAAIPAALYRYQGELKLAPQTVWFISAVLSHKWDADMPHPSLKRMAEETGVSRQQLHNYQRQLVEAGWLRVINRQTAQGGKDTSYYDFTALFTKLEALLARDRGEQGDANEGFHTHVNPSLHTHVNASGHTHVNPSLHLKEPYVEPLPDLDLSKFEKHSLKEKDGKRGLAQSVRRGAREAEEPIPIAAEHLASPPSRPHADERTPSSPPEGYVKLSELIAKRRQERAGTLPADGDPPQPLAPMPIDPVPIPVQRGRPPGTAEERALVSSYLSDFARQLGDEAPLSATVSRTLAILKRGNVPPERWVDLLFQAKATTWEHSAQIRKTPSASSRTGSAKVRIPYMLACLETLCGLREPHTGTAPRDGPVS